MKQLLIAFTVSCSLAYVSSAQEMTERQAAEYELTKSERSDQSRWYVSPGVGIMILDGPTDNEPVFFRLSLGYDLTDYFSVEGGMMYAPAHDAAPGVKGGQSAGPTADLLFHVLGKEGGRWDPYLTAGLAYWFANGDLFYEHHREVLVPRVGAGLAYHLTDDLSLRLEGKTGFPFKTRDIDDGWITTVELGMLYRFGGSSDNRGKAGLSVPTTPVENANYAEKLAQDTGGAIKDATPPGALDMMVYELYINFDWDQTAIKPEYNVGLNEISRVIKKAFEANPNATVSVEGHADQRHGSGVAYNQGLSERRAAVVKDFLVRSGVDTSKVRTIGYGFSRPKVRPIDLVNGNPENRRVDIFIHGVGDAASRDRLRAD
ncbi:MAG: OmpA family protein [Kiritimatiellaeota bacterium]|nr:OmpA family protein [Kiritimatiellota bacterium]